MWLTSFAAQVDFAPWFYPGSGKAEGYDESISERVKVASTHPAVLLEAHDRGVVATAAQPGSVCCAGVASNVTLQPVPVPEPLLEQAVRHPHIVNVAFPPGVHPKLWRRTMTAEVLPRLAAFKPDLILISAGFDGHYKDTINCGYLSLRDDDYDWITHQLMKIANTSAQGRVVSVLEGGYRIQGRIVSAFGRSVAAHVRALTLGTTETWDTAEEKVRLTCAC